MSEEERDKAEAGSPKIEPANAEPVEGEGPDARCPKCSGSGLHAGRTRFCSACLGTGKATKHHWGWQ